MSPTSSWATINKPEPVNLKDIMKQETGQQLQNIESNNLQSDEELARMLQNQFDEDLDDPTEDCAMDSDEDDLEQLSQYKEWQLLDDVVKERSHNRKKTAIARVPLSLSRAYRQPIHNQEKHLKAEQDLFEYTHIVINSMIKNKLFKSINGVVNIGEDSVIIHADSYNGRGNGLAIKVFNIYPTVCGNCAKYRTEAVNEAKDVYPYWWQNFVPKFSECRHKLKTYNKGAHELAVNEKNNLKRYKEAGVTCPEIVALKRHVLVTSFIGDNHIPASNLSQVDFTDIKNLRKAYLQITQAMKCLYEKANSVHENFSEKHILWHDGTCHFIDIDRIIDLSHDDAFQCLLNNCTFISNFFSSKKKKKRTDPIVASDEEMFYDIVGIRFDDTKGLTELRKRFRAKKT